MDEYNVVETKPPKILTKDFKHPMQPVGFDGRGVIRFKENKIVQYWLDNCKFDLHDLAIAMANGQFSEDDYIQAMQLIGYSVSGFGDLNITNRYVIRKADRKAREISKSNKNKFKGSSLDSFLESEGIVDDSQ